jgi:hypothetical protein
MNSLQFLVLVEYGWVVPTWSNMATSGLSVEPSIWTWFFLLGSDQDCQHNNLKLICGMIQLKLLRIVKKNVSFPEVWLQRGAAHGRAWNQTTLLEWHVSTNLHPVTLFMPSILPKGYLYFEKPQFWLRISKTIKSKHSLHPMQSETGVVPRGTPPNQWMSQGGPAGPLTKGPSAAKGCSWSFKFWIHCSASVKDP